MKIAVFTKNLSNPAYAAARMGAERAATPSGGSLDEAAQRNALERERWTRVIQAARITVD